MSDKIVVIISTSDAGKARTGIIYATNARNKGWLTDVKIVVFGPAEALLLKDAEIQKMLKEHQATQGSVVACKAVADREGLSGGISALGIPVEFVGKMISDLIKDGYTPMLW